MLTAYKSKRIINLIAVFTLILSTVVQFMLPGQTVLGAAESENIYSEKIMAKSSSSLELEIQGALPLATSYEVYRLVDGELEAVSYREVRVGAENVTVEVNQDNEITKMILNGYTPIENMRVGIMTTDFVTLEHDEIEVQSATGLEIVDKVADEILLINPNELITIQAQQHEVTIMTEDGTTLYTTTNRIYVSTEENGKIIVDNIRRGSEWTPVEASYRGFFEITATHSGDKLHLINEVNLEDYLYQVVPSEMPASFGLEALKAQSVAARTYALGDYFSERFTEDGFFVLDSVMSQVYNNAPENALTTQAVQETAGIVMRDETGGLVDARYYSTSAGYGASKHEVWSEADGTFPSSVVPYLLAQSHTFDPDNPDQMLELDTSDEEEMLHFFKTLSYTGYDDASDFFRWKTTLSKEELENTINKNLTLRQQADPKFVLTQNDAGQFVSLPIPEAGIGEFQDMYVTKRGEGGNIMDLVIEGTTGTYKVIKEYNIRFVIRPWSPDTGGDPVTLYMARAGSDGYDAPSREDFNILPSAFFSVEIDEESEDITFFGGGYGHGVGMSQYGAYHLGESKGWAFDEILTAYYPNMVLDDIYEENDTDPGDGDDNDTGDGSEVPTIEDMLALIVKFEEEGEFASDRVARALTIHLTSVNQFVKKEENEKVLKHMDGFKLLLDHHREQESVSELAYDTLLNQANQFVSSYETTLEIVEYLLPDRNSKERTETLTHVVLHFISNASLKPHDPYQIDDIYSIFTEYGVSSNYVIDRDGTIYLMVPEGRVAYHAGAGELPNFPEYKNKLNDYSIGVEMLAIGIKEEMIPIIGEDTFNLIDPSIIGYTDAQYEALNLLLNNIIKRNPDILKDREHVVGHDEYAPDRKTDPGSLFDWSKIGL